MMAYDFDECERESLQVNRKLNPTVAWALWKGEGPEPASWYAINPETGENTKIYRSYEDYVDD